MTHQQNKHFYTYKERLDLEFFDDRSGKQIIEHSKIDEQGRFEVRMPVNGPTIMGIHNENPQILL